jgi:hypothetical protein
MGSPRTAEPVRGAVPHFQTFEEFWPYYVHEHRLPVTRGLHFVGTHLGILAFVLGLTVSAWWLAAVPLLGYGFAWVGHFFFEKNQPATFTYPAWSFRGDLRMIRLTWLGRMGDEVARLNERASAS